MLDFIFKYFCRMLFWLGCFSLCIVFVLICFIFFWVILKIWFIFFKVLDCLLFNLKCSFSIFFFFGFNVCRMFFIFCCINCFMIVFLGEFIFVFVISFCDDKECIMSVISNLIFGIVCFWEVNLFMEVGDID